MALTTTQSETLIPTTPATFDTMAGVRTFEPFDMERLLSTVFDPIEGCKVCLLMDLDDTSLMKDFAYRDYPQYAVQKKAADVFYDGLHSGAMERLGLSGGDVFAYKTTGGSNLDLPDEAIALDGSTLSLETDVYPNYDLILCVSDFSATAPLTASAKKHGFRGSTMHGLNDIILQSGLTKDYREVSKEAEKMRLGMTKADEVYIDFEIDEKIYTLTLVLDKQEAQKSHGLCHGRQPDIANLPAGEVYYVPTGAHGIFPMKYESDGTIALQYVEDGRIVKVELLKGSEATVQAHRETLKTDPITGEIGELGFGTQELPFCGADIQDEKTLGTVHVATGRSDHLGGHLTPDLFAEAQNASHDDILFHPNKTPEINIAQVRWRQDDREEILIEDYKPAAYLSGLFA